MFFSLISILLLFSASLAWAQPSFTEPTTLYVMHSSGKHLERGSDDGGWIEAPTKSNPQKMTIIPLGQGYYNIQVGSVFLSLSGQWNSKFISSSTGDEAKWTIEAGTGQYVRLRCKANNKYLGTDSNDAHQKVYTDKSGSDMKHLWYFSDNVRKAPPADTARYIVSPQVVRQHFDGWGVSLCWWAVQCG